MMVINKDGRFAKEFLLFIHRQGKFVPSYVHQKSKEEMCVPVIDGLYLYPPVTIFFDPTHVNESGVRYIPEDKDTFIAPLYFTIVRKFKPNTSIYANLTESDVRFIESEKRYFADAFVRNSYSGVRVGTFVYNLFVRTSDVAKILNDRRFILDSESTSAFVSLVKFTEEKIPVIHQRIASKIYRDYLEFSLQQNAVFANFGYQER
ncbi:MAG: hypothetical protein QXE51_00190 [Nitrososphaeria archaeon]